MYENLKGLGIEEPTQIDRYSLRQEASNDILKIYFHKQKGELFAKSVKFKYPRMKRTIRIHEGQKEELKLIDEIHPILNQIIEELDILCMREQQEVDLKRKILHDLRHLENVVASKINEIESDLERLLQDK